MYRDTKPNLFFSKTDGNRPFFQKEKVTELNNIESWFAAGLNWQNRENSWEPANLYLVAEIAVIDKILHVLLRFTPFIKRNAWIWDNAPQHSMKSKTKISVIRSQSCTSNQVKLFFEPCSAFFVQIWSLCLQSMWHQIGISTCRGWAGSSALYIIKLCGESTKEAEANLKLRSSVFVCFR
jgi:hypothetical protein